VAGKPGKLRAGGKRHGLAVKVGSWPQKWRASEQRYKVAPNVAGKPEEAAVRDAIG
jgi:hypothetical protein